MWFLESLGRKEELGEDIGQIKTQFQNMVSEDLDRFKPKLIFIVNHVELHHKLSDKIANQPPSYPVLDFMAGNSEFEKYWSAYTFKEQLKAKAYFQYPHHNAFVIFDVYEKIKP